MSLILSPRAIGQGWAPVQLGDLTYDLDQWYNPKARELGIPPWSPIPWHSSDRFQCRPGQNLRRPVSRAAKWEAFWAAKGKLFRRYILRKTS